MPTVGDVLSAVEELAPQALAADWDNVGLLLGDPVAEVRQVLTCLSVTPETASEATEGGCQLIVSHHPVLFRAVKRLTATDANGQVLLDLARAGVAVISPHSAWDDAPGGINDQLAGLLGLKAVGPLRAAAGPASCKVVVFVPEADLARVSDAVFAAGAGRIGAYSQCSFRLAGTGTFFASAEASPAVGRRGRREEVAEWRLEVVAPTDRIPAVLDAVRRSHSYEEPAVDVYPLVTLPARAGAGRIGTLEPEAALDQIALALRSAVGGGAVQLVGDPSATVRRVAVACGAGGGLLSDAAAAGVDLFVTGELRFHDCLAARAHGLGVVMLGHYASERPGVEELARRLRSRFPQLDVWASRRETDPVRTL